MPVLYLTLTDIFIFLGLHIILLFKILKKYLDASKLQEAKIVNKFKIVNILE